MKPYVVVLAIDIILAATLVYVVGDQQWRVAYAESSHARTTGYATSFSYSVFTQVFTMAGKGISLASPLTLDWVQVLAVVLFAVNAWFAYVTLAGRRRKPAPDAPPIRSDSE